MLQTFSKLRVTHTILTLRSVSLIHANTFKYKTRMEQFFSGGVDVTQQSIEINPTERIRRYLLDKDADIWTLYKTMCPNVRTLGDALQEGYVASNDGPCVGFLQSSNGTESLQWLSYSTVMERCRYIGSYLLTKTKLIPKQSKVATISSNRPEYLFVEQGCYMYGFIIVSLYTTYDAAAIQNVLQRTQAEVLVVDNLERIQSFQDELLNNNQIKEILVLDDIKYDEKSKIRPISSIFKSMKKTDICERPKIDPDDVATFILTSGTTGRIEKNK
jgi:long-chain acyl-CoA synthetase